MKKKIALLCISACILGCSDDSSGASKQLKGLGDACSGKGECAEGLECAYGICVSSDDPCVTLKCDEGVLCRDGACQVSGDLCGDHECDPGQTCQSGRCVDLCGGIVCGNDELCISERCIKKTDTCAGVLCSSDEICFNRRCENKNATFCGEAVCLDSEVCLKGRCESKDILLCNGVSCGEDEVCFKNQCRKKGDCGGIDCGDKAYCFLNICFDKEQCGDEYCDNGFVCVDEDCMRVYCDDGSEPCGGECCESGFCGIRENCCDYDKACGRDCCQEGEVCEYESCHIACAENVARCATDDGREICCAEGEICTAGQCFRAEVSCVDNYMCDEGQFCDAAMKTCLPKPTSPVCQANPVGGEVQPTLVWHWGEGVLAPKSDEYPEHVRVMSTPMVADIDNDKIPEVIFNSWRGKNSSSIGENQITAGYNGNGILRILDGKTGQMKYFSQPTYYDPTNKNPGTCDYKTYKPAEWYFTDGGSQTAVGDLIPSNEGLEIATCIRVGQNFKLAVFDNHARMLWHSEEKDASGNLYNECGQSGPGIADFNGDGQPELYSRYNVFTFEDKKGILVAHQPCDGESGYQHVMADYSVAADLDGDGLPELVGGKVAYKVDVANKSMKPLWMNDKEPEGYPAIANLDMDENGTPEVVVVRSGSHSIMAFNGIDGSYFWKNPVDINDDIPESDMTNGPGGGGPANIGNLDDDEYPEITLAGAYAFIVFEHDGKVKWKRRTHDFSSRKTGSSIFDFDGDGRAEAVYADEYFLRVYDGKSGNTRFCKCNTSATHWEYPVVVDVNNDDHAEIVVSSNVYNNCSIALTDKTGLDDCVAAIQAEGKTNSEVVRATNGVRVFSSPNEDWVNTRKIYNQHAYSVTNVSDDGKIPKKAKANWKTQGLNNFRLNVQPGATYLPDLEIRDITSKYSCNIPIPVYFRVVNTGWASAPAGIKIHAWVQKNATEFVEVGTVSTTKPLRATESEYLNFEFNENIPAYMNSYRFKFTFGDDAPEQCHSDNDSSEYLLNCPVN